jgi:kexin
VRPFNPYSGFGAADARAAVELAKSWQSVGRSGDGSLIRCGPYTRNYSIPIPDDASQFRIDTIDVNDCGIGKIEFVEIGFSATHPYSGDLRVDLSSPRGTKSRLADARICNPDLDGIADNCGNYEDWRFGSVRHLDETATGSWRLQVSDLLPDDAGSGTWTGWNLTIWGRR